MKITGTWHGEYTYGPGYEQIAGKSVPFVLSLTESWMRRIAGYVRDDASKGGMPERGRIAGSRRAATITFVKTMPIGYVMDADGKPLDPRVALRRDHGIEVPELPPHRIHYSGTLAQDGQSIAGSWVIRQTTIETDQGVLESAGGDGTWTARRVSDLPAEV